MLRTLVSLAGFALFLILTSTAQADETHAIDATDGNGLSVQSSTVVDERTLDMTFTTDALPFPATVRIVVPNGYANDDQRYPVIFLLHGGGENRRQWTYLGANSATADQPVILIQPSGGKGSWFMDARHPGIDGHPQWETWITTQLIPWVDDHLRTWGTREGRAIAGLSMGGFGAMSYAGNHPDLFISASAYSGAVDTRAALISYWIGVSPIIDGRLPFSIFGVYPDDAPWRLAHNPWNLAENLRSLRHIALYYGNGQRGPLDTWEQGAPPAGERFMAWIQENQVHYMNVNLHKRLTALGIPHENHGYGNGMHTGGYWERSFREDLPAIMATFADADTDSLMYE